MSEYQYYEFLALDKPLTDKQRAELLELSTRAEISATRFVNEYQWGDFGGDPELLMERYFDAFLYLANWGTRRLMFRLPSGVLNAETAALYCYTDAASVTEADDHLVIGLYYADREPDDDWVEGNGQLASMLQARVELAAGDLRLLYLGWLLAIQLGEVDDEEAEPPVPAGLDDLSAPLQAIAEFLDIDEDLLAVAAETSPGIMVEEDDGLTEWIAAMSVTEKDALLTMVANGEGAQVQWQLLRRFRRNAGGEAPSRGPVIASRTVAELLDAAEDHRAAREMAAELRRREEEAREAAAKAAAYAKPRQSAVKRV
jgi:hypothetical protein